MSQKTHREVKEPTISVRFLADYMAASERGKRTVVLGCKYHAKARVIQHDEAKVAIMAFVRGGCTDVTTLLATAQALKSRMATDEFERDLFDHNADYITRFAAIYSLIELPDADMLPLRKFAPIKLNGVLVSFEPNFLFRRIVAKTNKVKIGAGMLRYAKAKALSPEVAAYQSAIILGVLKAQKTDDGSEPDPNLCLTIDGYKGAVYKAPTDAVTRFHNAKAACATIAERWPAIAPPPGAIL